MPATTTSIVPADPCAKKIDVDAEQNDQKKHLESFLKRELRILHRNYRKLQEEEFSNKVSGSRHKSHSRLMQQMKEEKQTLLMLVRKLGMSTGPTSVASIEALIDVYISQASLVEDCIAALHEISHYVTHIVTVLGKHKRQVMKTFGEFPTPEKLCRMLEILEQKFYLINTQYNTILSQSTKLRLDIQGLMVERMLFFKRMKNYKQSIEWVKNQSHFVVQKTNLCYDKYDDAKHQQKSIIRRHDFESHMFVNEMKESVRFLKSDSSKKKFFNIKNKLRPSLEVESNRVRRRMQTIIESFSKVIPRYRKAFKAISEASRTSGDVDMVRQIYLQTDIQNFVTFRQLAEINDCIKTITKDIQRIRNNIVQVQAVQEEEKQRRLNTLKQLKDRNLEAKSELLQWRQQLDHKLKEVADIVQSFENVFTLAGASKTNAIKLLDVDTTITPRNILVYMKVFEHQILDLVRQKEVLQMETLSSQQTQELLIVQFLQKNIKHRTRHFGGAIKPNMIIPSSLETNNEEEEDRLFSKRRYTYPELREMCMEVISKSVDFIKALISVKSFDGAVESGDDDNLSIINN